jgi:tetratricopeptide (TPR) repeat protein
LYRAEFDVALDLNYQSLLLRQEDGDTMELATVLQNLGLIHYKLKDFETSIEYTKKSIELIEALEEKQDWVPAYLRIGYANLATVYYAKHKYLLAHQYYRRAFLIPKRSSYAEVSSNLVWEYAESFRQIGRLDSAMYYVMKAIQEATAAGNKYALANSYVVASQVMADIQDWGKANTYLKNAIDIDDEHSYPKLHEYVLRQKLRILAAEVGGSRVFEALENYERYLDSLEIINGSSRIRSLQLAFAQRENESKLKAQSSIMALQKENLDRQQVFVLVVSILLIVLLALSMALYRANSKKQAINQMLDRIVETRTRELSRHRDVLQHFIDEENNRRSRATAELMSLLNSLKGLLHLAKVDPGTREGDYFERALGLTSQMEGVSQKYSEQSQRKPPVITS